MKHVNWLINYICETQYLSIITVSCFRISSPFLFLYLPLTMVQSGVLHHFPSSAGMAKSSTGSARIQLPGKSRKKGGRQHVIMNLWIIKDHYESFARKRQKKSNGMRRARVAIRMLGVKRHNSIHAHTIQLGNMSYTLKHISHHIFEQRTMRLLVVFHC